MPVIEESARDVKTGVQLAVLGVDTLSDYQGARLRRHRARRHDRGRAGVPERPARRAGHDRVRAPLCGSRPAPTLTLETTAGRIRFTVRGTLEPRGPAKVFGGDLLVMDVYAAQVAFERGRSFDRIDILPDAGHERRTSSKRASARRSRGKAEVGKPKRRSQEAERILAGFKLGLSAGVAGRDLRRRVHHLQRARDRGRAAPARDRHPARARHAALAGLVLVPGRGAADGRARRVHRARPRPVAGAARCWRWSAAPCRRCSSR